MDTRGSRRAWGFVAGVVRLTVVAAVVCAALAAAAEAQAPPSRGPSYGTVAPKRAAPVPPEKTTPPAQLGTAPDGRAECGWVGTRILSLLARDDIDGANQFYQFFTAFKCPVEHLAVAFRCLASEPIVPTAETLSDKINWCWANPSSRPLPQTAPPAKTNEAKPATAPPADGRASRPPASRH